MQKTLLQPFFFPSKNINVYNSRYSVFILSDSLRSCIYVFPHPFYSSFPNVLYISDIVNLHIPGDFHVSFTLGFLYYIYYVYFKENVAAGLLSRIYTRSTHNLYPRDPYSAHFISVILVYSFHICDLYSIFLVN